MPSDWPPHLIPVDNNPPFIPPPVGVSNGGEPGGFYAAFPGAGGGSERGGYSHSPWPQAQPINGTPYPTYQQLAQAQSSASSASVWPTPPLSPGGGGVAWGYAAGYNPVNGPPPASAPAAVPATWGVPNTPSANGWAQPGPSATWGPPGSTYNAFPGWNEGPIQQYTPQSQPPGTPYESISGQPITGGWFGSAPEQTRKKKHSDHGHAWDSSMRRSHSQLEAPKRPSLKRSSSWGAAIGGTGPHTPTQNPYVYGTPSSPYAYQGFFGGDNVQYVPNRPLTPQTPGFLQSDQFDENNLARRPRDWRPDFSARPGFTSMIPKVIGKTNSTVKDWSDPVRREIHPLLNYIPNRQPLYFDLRYPPFSHENINFLNLHRPSNEIDFAQLALKPTCSFMRISHPRLPWYIDVYEQHPNGITVLDVLRAINTQLHFPIQQRHYWNEEFGDAERKTIGMAYQHRVKDDQSMINKGILQVDFLGEKCVLEGFIRIGKGVWEMKTRRQD